MSEPIVDVIFRVYPAGDVLALFPDEPATVDGRHCTCYQRMGQHSTADYTECIRATRPALPAEYTALYRELTSAPYHYRLRVIQRRNRRT